MIKVSEVAEQLNVSMRTVTRWIEEGKLPAFKFGKDYRIKSEDLNRFIENSKVTPTEET